MVEYLFTIMLALAVGLVYFLSDRVKISNKKNHHIVASFAAGVSITYLLLDLFPQFTEVALGINRLLFLSVLFGFIIHHVIEKEIYMHNKHHDLIRRLTQEEVVFSFTYHFIIGIVLVTFAQQEAIRAILYVIPMSSFIFVNNLPKKPHKKHHITAWYASSTLFGTLFALFIWVQRPLWLETALTGLAIGVLLYTIIRHHIPFGRKGKVWSFTTGFIVYSAFIIASWYL